MASKAVAGGRGVASGYWFNHNGETSVSMAIGEDGTRPHGRHPAYLLGVSPDGHLIGLLSWVIWT